MYRNYFYLNRFIVELNQKLNGHKIRSIYSQEKDKLIIECTQDYEERFFLEISVNPGHPYILLKDDFRRARKNVADIFNEMTGAEIKNASIAASDRIIKFVTDKGNIFFLIRGKFTNIFSVTPTSSAFFKHNEELSPEDMSAELLNSEYLNSFNIPYVIIDEEISPAEVVKKKYPFIGKEILQEASARSDESDKTSFRNKLNEVMAEMMDVDPAVCIDKAANEVHIAPESFNIFNCSEQKTFSSLIPAMNYFISRKSQYELMAEKEKTAARFVEKELNKLTSRLTKLNERIARGNREEEYNKTGNLLLIYRHLIKKGMKELKAADIYSSGEEVTIKLNPSHSPQQNIESYFEKSKSEKINFEKSQQLLRTAEMQFNKFRRIKERLKNITGSDELSGIMKELKIRDKILQNEKEDLKDKFKQYIIENKYQVFVGRDSKNNDLLTTKFAKQNDYWFHARSLPGSHVILRNDTKEPVPKNILKKAAALAAYHSKAKTAGLVPVTYTFKKYVIKKKGMEPGKVALLREEVLLVRPEIDEGVEFISNE